MAQVGDSNSSRRMEFWNRGWASKSTWEQNWDYRYCGGLQFTFLRPFIVEETGLVQYGSRVNTTAIFFCDANDVEAPDPKPLRTIAEISGIDADTVEDRKRSQVVPCQSFKFLELVAFIALLYRIVWECASAVNVFVKES